MVQKYFENNELLQKLMKGMLFIFSCNTGPYYRKTEGVQTKFIVIYSCSIGYQILASISGL